MIKFKTNEEYILNELYKTQEELQLAKKKIEELEEEKNNLVNKNKEDMKCIYLSDKPYYWYSFNVESEYNWNKILKENKKTPKLVEKALTDDKALNQLCKLNSKDIWRSKLGYVNERVYNYLFLGRNGLYSVIETNQSSTDMYTINESNNYFLSKEEAEEKFKKEMRDRINYYLRNYKDKFDEEI